MTLKRRSFLATPITKWLIQAPCKAPTAPRSPAQLQETSAAADTKENAMEKTRARRRKRGKKMARDSAISLPDSPTQILASDPTGVLSSQEDIKKTCLEFTFTMSTVGVVVSKQAAPSPPKLGGTCAGAGCSRKKE